MKFYAVLSLILVLLGLSGMAAGIFVMKKKSAFGGFTTFGVSFFLTLISAIFLLSTSFFSV